MELVVAARTDRELQAAIQPIWAKSQQKIRDQARMLLPGMVDHIPDFDTAVEVVTMFYEGEAMNHVLNPLTDSDDRRAAWVGDCLRKMVGSAP